MTNNLSVNAIKVSVRNLVEFVLMNGDLASGFTSSSRTTDAIKAHQIVQRTSPELYTPEVTIAYATEIEGISFQINGRADGVITRENEICIDEIKTTTKPLDMIEEDSNPLHWAQAKCYAYIYGTQNTLNSIGVQLTYYQLDTKERKYFGKVFALVELQIFFENLLASYLKWARLLQNWAQIRDSSIEQLKFPFSTYRLGQRELAGGVYKTIREGQKLFVEAPTGIGKTAATLYPSLKALRDGYTSKLFYLTAKTITRTIAEGAIDQMRGQGLRVKSVTLTAKDKICAQPGAACTPEECQYAKGYYDRLRIASEEIFTRDTWDRSAIEQCAHKFLICPFEFSLDLALWADVIICDYNYVFDPRVYLKRFFMDGGKDFAFLIDEAHNLLDRAREMYSAELTKKKFLDLKKATKNVVPGVAKCLHKINSVLVEFRKDCEKQDGFVLVQKEAPKALYPLLRQFNRLAEEYLVQNQPSTFREDLLELYFQVMTFLRTAEFYDERYVTYFEQLEHDFRVKLFCLDPAHLLNEAMMRGKAIILFSATLTPLEYFIQTLGGEEDSYKLRLSSPFYQENFCLMIDDKISTKYRMRANSYHQIAQVIAQVVQARQGNYLAFFPSFEYLREVQACFRELQTDVVVINQTSGMVESAREAFLRSFTEENEESLIGFAVMGGIFGEGIDLTGDRLSGAIIVGVGLPQVCLEREVIRSYFQDEKGMGFEYAYIYPGMNKVVQAAGRVIRTETDRGVVVLIDDRFSQASYRRLLPTEWQPARIISQQGLQDKLRNFWYH